MKKTDKQYKTRKQTGKILGLLESLEPGESFYTSLPGKVVTRYNAQYQRKIKIETEYSINPKTKSVTKLLKVTIL